jgi:predicted dehydrogenase
MLCIFRFPSSRLPYRLAGGADWSSLAFEKPNRFVRQAANFLSAIQAGRTPQPGPEDGLAVMRVIGAAYASARQG